MLKTTEYDVNGQIAGTVREVSELLGFKVSKADILSGAVPGVRLMDASTGAEVDVDTVAENIEEKVAEGAMSEEEAMQELQQVQGDTDASEDTDSADTTDDVKPNPDEAAPDNAHIDDPVPKVDMKSIFPENYNEDGSMKEPTSQGLDMEPAKQDVPPPEPPKSNAPASMDELRAKLAAIRAAKGAPAPTTKKPVPGEPIEYPEKGSFKDEKELKKFYKKLTDDQLDEWLQLEGLTYKACPENAPIERMRKCMSLMAYHFPKAPTTSKKKSKYADLSTEQLMQIATEAGVTVRDDHGDLRILRMYLIMALRDAGLLE
jgi:hypothetical protein